ALDSIAPPTFTFHSARTPAASSNAVQIIDRAIRTFAVVIGVAECGDDRRFGPALPFLLSGLANFRAIISPLLPTHVPRSRYSPRTVSDRRPNRRGGNGRSLSREGRSSCSRRRAQGTARAIRAGSGARRQVRARSEGSGFVESPEYRHHSWPG